MKTKALLILTFCLLITGVLQAQQNGKRIDFELNGGASMATSKPGGTQLNPGFGFEGTFQFRILKHTGIFAAHPYRITSGQVVCTITSKLKMQPAKLLAILVMD
jgi:hypothetical protein